jgi:hypothetical protein
MSVYFCSKIVHVVKHEVTVTYAVPCIFELKSQFDACCTPAIHAVALKAAVHERIENGREHDLTVDRVRNVDTRKWRCANGAHLSGLIIHDSL